MHERFAPDNSLQFAPQAVSGGRLASQSAGVGAGSVAVARIPITPGCSVHLDIYSQRVSAMGGPLWTADGVALCSNSGPTLPTLGVVLDISFTPPRVASDGAGGIIATWWTDRGGSGIDIYA